MRKSRLKCHLDNLAALPTGSAFDDLLLDYRSEQLKHRLRKLGLPKPRIHIDWHPDYRCIDIQGRCGAFLVDIQVEPLEFFVAYDTVEPDESIYYPLQSAGQFYAVVGEMLATIQLHAEQQDDETRR